MGAAMVSSISNLASAPIAVALLWRAAGFAAEAMLLPRRTDVSDYSGMAITLRRYVADRLPA